MYKKDLLWGCYGLWHKTSIQNHYLLTFSSFISNSAFSQSLTLKWFFAKSYTQMIFLSFPSFSIMSLITSHVFFSHTSSSLISIPCGVYTRKLHEKIFCSIKTLKVYMFWLLISHLYLYNWHCTTCLLYTIWFTWRDETCDVQTLQIVEDLQDASHTYPCG